MDMTKEIIIVDTITNEEFIGKIYQERKSSYLIRFKIGVLPFSKNSGKIFGKNVQHNNYAIKMGA